MDKIVIDLKERAVVVYPDPITLNVNPTTQSQQFTPVDGYYYEKVNVSAVTNSIDSNIKAENIKKDVAILGVIGTLEESILPEVTNGTLIFSKNASVNEGVLEI